MTQSKPIDIINRELTFVEVLKYFEERGSEAAATVPVIKPRGGEVYLYSFRDDNRSKLCM